jgi:hypothetical protein
MGTGKGGAPTQVQQQTNQNVAYTPTGLQGFQNIYNQASNVANTPYQPYTGELVAGVNPTEQQGIAQTQAVGSQPLTQNQIQQYMNPYQSQVINATMGNIEQVNAAQQQQVTGQLNQAAGGVGADRVAVGQSQLAYQQGLAANQTLAGLNAQNYAQGLGAAQQQQQFGLQGAGAQIQAGGLQQQTQQAQDTAQYQQYLQQLAFPYQQAQFLAGIGLPALGGMGGYQTQIGQTGETITPPGLTWPQAIVGGGLIAGGLGNAFGGSNAAQAPASVTAGAGNLGTTATGGRINPYAVGGHIGHYAIGGGDPGIGSQSGSPDDMPWDASAINITGGGSSPGQSIQVPGSQIKAMPQPNIQIPQAANSNTQSNPLTGAATAAQLGSAFKGLGNLYTTAQNALVPSPSYGGGTSLTDAYGGSAANPLPGLDASDYSGTAASVTADAPAYSLASAGIDPALTSASGAAADAGMDAAGMGLADAGIGVAADVGADAAVDVGAAGAADAGAASIADILPFLALAKRGGAIRGYDTGGSPYPIIPQGVMGMAGGSDPGEAATAQDDYLQTMHQMQTAPRAQAAGGRLHFDDGGPTPDAYGYSSNPYALNRVRGRVPLQRDANGNPMIQPGKPNFGTPMMPPRLLPAQTPNPEQGSNYLEQMGQMMELANNQKIRQVFGQRRGGGIQHFDEGGADDTLPDVASPDYVGSNRGIETLLEGHPAVRAALTEPAVPSAPPAPAQTPPSYLNANSLGAYPRPATPDVDTAPPTSTPNVGPAPPTMPRVRPPVAAAPPVPQDPGLARTGLGTRDQDVLNLRNYQSSVPQNPGIISKFQDPATRSDALFRMGANILAAPPGDKLGIQGIGRGIAATEQNFDKQWDSTMSAAEKGRDLGEKMMEDSRRQALEASKLDVERARLEQGKFSATNYIGADGQYHVGIFDPKHGQILDPDTHQPIAVGRLAGRNAGIETQNHLATLAETNAKADAAAYQADPIGTVNRERAKVGLPPAAQANMPGGAAAAGTATQSSPTKPLTLAPGQKPVHLEYYQQPDGTVRQYLGP